MIVLIGPAEQLVSPCVVALMTRTLLRSSDDLSNLRAVLDSTANLAELEHYLRCRELGLRQKMARPLEAFAKEAAAWPFEHRRALVLWIGEPWIASAGYEPTSRFAKRGDPVFRMVVVPTLTEWRLREPDDLDAPLLACLWDEPSYNRTESRMACLRALLNQHPASLPARRALIRAVVDQIGFNQHEWPHGYLGDPAQDVQSLGEAEELLEHWPNDEWRHWIASVIAEMQEVGRSAVERRSARRSITATE